MRKRVILNLEDDNIVTDGGLVLYYSLSKAMDLNGAPVVLEVVPEPGDQEPNAVLKLVDKGLCVDDLVKLRASKLI